MRLFPPHFACPALLQNIPRHTIVRYKFTRLAAPARPLQPRRVYSVQSSIGLLDDDMGKDDKSKNFNLKVPKGTRDCTPCSQPLCRVFELDQFADVTRDR